MTLSLQPPTHPGDARNPEDELDGLLRDYFRAETPNPWPHPVGAVGRQEVLSHRRVALMRSRLALAASIALILLGSLFLARLPRDLPPGEVPALSAPEAKRIKVKDVYLNVKPDGSTELKSEAAFEEDVPPSRR
jgi:hypothetical protein